MLLFMAFRATVAQIEDAACRLRADRDRISDRVGTLLDGGWQGGAATSYAAGWAEWREGADQVLAGLEAMVSLLRAVEADAVERDVSAGVSVERIAARLG